MYEFKSWIVHIGLPGGSCRYIPSSPSAAPALAVLATNACEPQSCFRFPVGASQSENNVEHGLAVSHEAVMTLGSDACQST